MKSTMKGMQDNFEENTPYKEDFCKMTGRNVDTNEQNINSSALQNEIVPCEIDGPIDMSKNLDSEEIPLEKRDENVQMTPCKKQTARKTLWSGNINLFGTYEKQNAESKSDTTTDDDSQNMAAKVLHFFCQKCKNGIRYSPNDLEKHFQILHNGELPLYPCEMCNFSTSYFHEFKQHRKTHRNTLVKCEICNNDYLFTLLDLTKHFTTMHCVNGHFNCTKCKFSTRDVGTFVQHIHRHNGIEYACQKCNHVSFSKKDFQKHLQGHSALFPFSCKYCNYSSMRKDFIVKHVLARHREHVQTKEELEEETCETQVVQTSTGQKVALKPNQSDAGKSVRQDSYDTEDNTQNRNDLHFKSFDQSQVSKSLASSNMDVDHNMEDGVSSGNTVKCNSEESSVNLLKNAVHGPTVLMVKNNKINVPANYTATFMGYRMVDGKQNIVIKLLPSNKQSVNVQLPSQQSNNLTPVSRVSSVVQSNCIDNGTSQMYRSNIPCSSSVVSREKPKGSIWSTGQTAAYSSVTSRSHALPNSIKMGSAASQPFLKNNQRDFIYHGVPTSSFSSDFLRSIKKEPGEYSVDELQNKQLASDHNYQSAVGQNYQSRDSCSASVGSKIEHLFDHRSSDRSGTMASESFLSKELNELKRARFLQSARKAGNFTFTNTNINLRSHNNFAGRDAHLISKQSLSLANNGFDSSSMPKITSVFSLKSQQSETTASKNNFLHSMQHEHLKDKMYVAKPQNMLVGSGAFASIKQSASSLASKYDMRRSNGDTNTNRNIASAAMFIKQEPESHGYFTSTAKPSVVKTHSDAIVSQQLAKDKILGFTKPASGAPALQILQHPQSSGIPQNTVLYPSSSRLLFPLLHPSQSGLKLPTSQAPTSSSPSNKGSAPVAVNTQSSMLLTFTNAPFGAIRNVSNDNCIIGAVNSQGKLPLSRLHRPAVPHFLQTDITNNLSANMVSGSSVGKNAPINLNVLQYCVNSDGSGVPSRNSEQVNKPLNKQPIYALLPDGKQAVLLNYVLPKGAAVNAQKFASRNTCNQAFQLKKTEHAPQTSLRASSTVSVKVEDTDDALMEKNIAHNISGNAVGQKPYSVKMRAEHAVSSRRDSKGRFISLRSMRTQNETKYKQNFFNTLNTKGKPLKRKASVETKKNSNNYLEGPPRKKMLHRKCKEKVYSSDIYDADISTPSASKDIVRTLGLCPFSSSQLIKFPLQNQPVVVLNHPDADIPEVVHIMKTISKFEGGILKVSLSKETIDAFLESKYNSSAEVGSDEFYGKRLRREKPANSVKERFVLKLTLKKTSKNNYKIVKNTSGNQYKTKFNCWFCGRIFDNQDEWVGHGQRHLMEATKDWNTLS
ncbi:zinc finger protein 518A [Bombina bombina]|uniref:zinc finger protein 518A n=1 Tax=Bombina bombina TaxID=8345 RepID=UPI00235A6B7D|nr:zinc finger protein 518A [Bombina bombina]